MWWWVTPLAATASPLCLESVTTGVSTALLDYDPNFSSGRLVLPDLPWNPVFTVALMVFLKYTFDFVTLLGRNLRQPWQGHQTRVNALCQLPLSPLLSHVPLTHPADHPVHSAPSLWTPCYARLLQLARLKGVLWEAIHTAPSQVGWLTFASPYHMLILCPRSLTSHCDSGSVSILPLPGPSRE